METGSATEQPPHPYRVRRGGIEDLDALEPLWLAVHHAHQAAMPALAPYVDDATSWRECRRLYQEVLGRPDTLLLLAYAGQDLVGCALAHVLPLDETWVGDTWVTGRRIGEIETLSILPEHRGHGLGGYLLRALEAHLHARDVPDLILGALPGNTDALRLYERHGYRPTWIYLSKFDGR